MIRIHQPKQIITNKFAVWSWRQMRHYHSLHHCAIFYSEELQEFHTIYPKELKKITDLEEECNSFIGID